MPFDRPTLAQLVARVRADIQSRLLGSDAFLRRHFESVLGAVAAGHIHGLYGYQAWIAKQLIINTAAEETVIRRAAEYGVFRKSAQPASGPLLATGTDGTVIPADTLFQRSDGFQYKWKEDVTITGGEALGTVTATDDYFGVDGNCDTGQTLNLVSPIAGVDTAATVQSPGIENGQDLEGVESLRSRLLLRIQNPPKGGGPGDYEVWAREVAGVTRAFQLKNYGGLGKVGVPFLTDGEADPIPTAAKVAEVQAYLEARAPITAAVTAFAPTALVTNITLTSLTPNTAAVQAAVTAELADLWLRKATVGGRIYLSQINEAISIAEGEEDHTLGSPAADVQAAAGEMPILGTVTFP